jgi:hypothetical protein
MMTVEQAQARSEIQHLVTSWSVSCDRNSPADWVWADDAVVLAPGGVRIEGRNNIMGRFRGGAYAYTTRLSDTPVTTDKPPVAPASALSPSGEAPWLRHNLTTVLIEFGSADTATSLIYFLVISGSGLTGTGRYEDKYRKIDGEWRIAERKTRLEFIPPNAQWDAARAIATADRAEEAKLV